MYPHVKQFEVREQRFVRPRPPGPRRYKLALLTWAAAYAVITLVLEVLGPAMDGWPLGLRTFVLSALMVASLTWLLMPALTRLFRPWLMASG
jgi:antibiotic biosynthesis monooxygenase (ABM) superfamily enzyme